MFSPVERNVLITVVAPVLLKKFAGIGYAKGVALTVGGLALMYKGQLLTAYGLNKIQLDDSFGAMGAPPAQTPSGADLAV